ncbi:LAMI_0E15148g1_1 [Lachancea mirantina]|uniref:DNA damage-binding protein CMR1 n=1 Tax=Lachancea mirantina TaxID=1230905 RepID=A0A1G4JS50_9SACH|nr:LAMI_0E15148g1_1 [Lachancea mirantina]
MAELSDFQKRRLENIKRNNDLLKKLNLNAASRQLKRDAGIDGHRQPKKKSIKKKEVKREPKEPKVPTRRSRRLMGELADGNTPSSLNEDQLFKQNREVEDLKKIKETPVIGDIKLSDLIKDEDENKLEARFVGYGNKNFSSGDFFKELQKYQKPPSDVQELQQKFDLQMYDIFQPNEIKLTQDRISAMFFHPSEDKKLIVGGDTTGHVGLWNVTDTDPQDQLVEPEITKFKLFTKNVGRIDVMPSDLSKILTASYDGILRSIDLNTLNSEEILTLENEYGEAVGISDYQFQTNDPHHILLTTLSGEFATFDVRSKPSNVSLRRLADKKIGSFSVNPRRPHEIATGSLDRTLKIWDLRKIVKNPEWSQFENCSSYHIVSIYDSRLSVSAVSYSPSGESLVCNGYDDTIRLFDVRHEPKEQLEPKITLKHNCQTGRWTSILKARFKPNTDVFAIANMSRAIDIYNSEGQQLAHLKTATVPAVVSWHPLQNWIVGGNSSGKAFLFTDNSGSS